jgi:hypothetical protein
MTHAHTKLLLDGEGFNQQPVCWRNFVNHVFRERKLSDTPSREVLNIIEEVLITYNLHTEYLLDQRWVVGTPEDLMAWMLAYS